MYITVVSTAVNALTVPSLGRVSKLANCLCCKKIIPNWSNRKYCDTMCMRKHRLLGDRTWGSPTNIFGRQRTKKGWKLRWAPRKEPVVFCMECMKQINRKELTNSSFYVLVRRKFCNRSCYNEFRRKNDWRSLGTAKAEKMLLTGVWD